MKKQFKFKRKNNYNQGQKNKFKRLKKEIRNKNIKFFYYKLKNN